MRSLPLLLRGSLVVLLLTQCTKKDPTPQLPAETTTGAMTFGCKIDGRVFGPRTAYPNPGLDVRYDYLGSGKGGGFFLSIPATDWTAKPIETVHITTDSLLVQEGQTYPFRTSSGSARAEYYAAMDYLKLDQNEGELTITHFDPNRGIISGRFHFVGTNKATGRQVKVTDGRFDVRF